MLSKHGRGVPRYGIANCLWPKTLIATAAIEHEVGGPQLMAQGQQTEIMADAAVSILSRSADELTGQALIDEDVLRQDGVRGLRTLPVCRRRQGDAGSVPGLAAAARLMRGSKPIKTMTTETDAP